MTVVVEPTLPFSSAELGLGAHGDWGRLFPLIKPDYRVVQTSTGHTVVVNKVIAGSDVVPVVAIIRPGNFFEQASPRNYTGRIRS